MTSVIAAILRCRNELSLRRLVTASKMQLQLLRLKICYLPFRPSGTILPQITSALPAFPPAGGRERLTLFSSEQSRDDASSGGSSGGGDDPKARPLKLMDYEKLRWPHPINTLRNYIFSTLIQISFDQDFSMKSFLAGAQQAVSTVSELISRGSFDELEGLVTREAVQEVSRNYSSLTDVQRKFLAVNTNDFFLRFIYEIGMIFDDNTQKRFVEITTVFQGLHGLDHAKMKYEHRYLQHIDREATYVCNYRFIREYTKGKEDSWTINVLNHFQISEME